MLCRLALGENKIDPAGFTLIRLLSGTGILALILLIKSKKHGMRSTGSRRASLMLFLYALCFSYAYIFLDTGTGALILFGMVQITMISAGLIKGHRMLLPEWIGTILAFSGFVYLVWPILTTPSWTGSLMMTAAGAAWAFYTLAGSRSKNPVDETAYNFIRTLPFVLILLIFSLPKLSFSSTGIILAIGSGALASGLGYVLWYAALRGLSNIQAAVVQLMVPLMAAGGGLIFAGESISLHLVLSAVAILGGIFIVILAK